MKQLICGLPFLISGLICDRGLTLGDLQGVLYDFFSRLGKAVVVTLCYTFRVCLMKGWKMLKRLLIYMLS